MLLSFQASALTPQTITFPDFGLKTAGGASFTLGATASSGLPVTYTSSNTSVATVSGSIVTIVAAGNAVITASQAGDATYDPAPSVVQGLLVGLAAPASVPINAMAGVPGNLASAGTVPVTGNRATYTPLFSPTAVTVDGSGNVYFTDNNSGGTTNAGRVFKVAAGTGLITLIAGNGSITNSVTATGAVTATGTGFDQLRGIAVNSAGTILYVAERTGRRVSRIDLTATTSNLTLYAGNGTVTPTGTTPKTVTMGPHGLALAADGTLYIADNANRLIRQIDPTGTTITTVAGINGTTGSADGAVGTSTLGGPQGISLSPNRDGNLHIADNTNNSIRILNTSTNNLSTLTLTGTNAALTAPNSITLDYNGNIYVGEANRVRKYSSTGALLTSTYAGNNTAFGAGNLAPANGRVASGAAVMPTSLAILNNTLYTASGGTYSVEAVTDNNLLLAQSITFPDFGVKTYSSGATFTVTATASSGMAVTFTSSNTGVATVGATTLTNGVSTAMVTLVAAGNAYITASQAGDATTQAAASVVQGLLVGQTIPATVRPIYAVAGVPGITISGLVPVTGYRATYSPLTNPYAVVADTVGNVYYIDYDASNQGRVYKINASGVLSLVAGNGTTTYGATATTAVTATATGLNQPRGLAVNRAGTVLYVSERTGRRVSKIDLTATTNNLMLYAGLASGASTPVATLGTGAVTPTDYALPGPWGLALANNGTLYINENTDNTVRMINAAGTAMTIVAGTSGTASYTGDGGAATAATLNLPRGGLVVTRTGDLYIADYGNNVVRKVTAGGIISTVITGLTNPNSLALDYNGNFYVGELYRVRKYDATGTLVTGGSTFIGTNNNTDGAPANGAPSGSKVVTPTGLFLLANKLYIASPGTYSVAVVTDASFQLANPYSFTFDDFGVKTTGSASFTATSTLPTAATNAGLSVTYALTSFTGTTAPASVSSAGVVTISTSGNAIITASLGSNYYQNVSLTQGLLVGLATPASIPANALAGTPGLAQTAASTFATEGVRATYSQLYSPYGVAVDGSGNTYFTDYNTSLQGRVYKVTPAGVLTTIAGNGTTTYAAGGQATASGLNQPRSLVVNSAGTVLYVSEFAGHRVSRIDLSTGIITLYAGNGTITSTGSTPTTMAIPGAWGLALSSTGNLYIAAASTTASHNNASTILLVPAGGSTISVVAGQSGITGSTNGALGTNTLNNPRGLVLASNGDLYIADNGNNLVRKLTAATGVVSTFIDTYTNGTSGTNSPTALAFDENNNLYVGELYRVRKYSAAGAVLTSTYAGNNAAFNSGSNLAPVNGTAASSRAIVPTGLAVYNNRLFIASPATSAVQTITDSNLQDSLPVELTAFTAERQGTDALLRWTTASEKNSQGFEVQVSATGTEFRRLGWVVGKGNSTSPTQYRFSDQALTKLASPTVYYRLRQLDLDGTESYSPVRIVQVPVAAAGFILTLWPNPAHNTVRIAGLPGGQLVQLTDALGRAVLTATTPANGALDLTLPTELPAGLYIVRSGAISQRLAVE